MIDKWILSLQLHQKPRWKSICGGCGVIDSGSRRGGSSRDGGGSIIRWSGNTRRGGSSFCRGLGLWCTLLGGRGSSSCRVIGGGSRRGSGSRDNDGSFIADGATMSDVVAVPFAGAQTLDAPFLEGGAAAAAEWLAAAVDEAAATKTAVVAAVADGAEMPDASSVSRVPVGRPTASVVGVETGAAVAAATAAAAKIWWLLHQSSFPCFAWALALDAPFFSLRLSSFHGGVILATMWIIIIQTV